MWLNDLYHALDPVAFSFGPLTVRWYGLAYLAGFLCAGATMWRVQRRWCLGLSLDDLVSVLTAIALGIILGARLGYVIFYGGADYLVHPLRILAVNEGGMSFHGGLAGAIIAGSLGCRRLGLSIPTICDLGVIGAPWGLFFGRCANFVNGELWGKESDLPWAVMFSDVGGGAVYRHPSQLYEALLEGLVLFCVLYLLSRRLPPRPQGSFLGVFLMLYGIFRFCIEFVRLPDAQLGYLAGGWLTMGQLLSVPLVVIGVVELVRAQRLGRPQRAYRESPSKRALCLRGAGGNQREP